VVVGALIGGIRFVDQFVQVSISFLKRRNQMAIEIKTEKVWVNGEKHRRITGIKALSYEELPAEYFMDPVDCACVMTKYGFRVWRMPRDNGCRYSLDNDFRFKSNHGVAYHGDTIPEEEFQVFKSWVEKAGDNLMRVNKKLRESWSGKETFTI
jgi:hypothetical protein